MVDALLPRLGPANTLRNLKQIKMIKTSTIIITAKFCYSNEINFFSRNVLEQNFTLKLLISNTFCYHE